jgi:alkylation response protein AidB-like acyl-CoA dehydrogenase
MSLGGGRAYQQDGRLARLLRDARAAEVMAPTTHMLKGWLGRTLLGLPLF